MTGKLETEKPSPAVDPPEKNKKAKTASQLKPQLKPSEGSVKPEPLPELNASDDELKPRIEKGSGEGLRATLSSDSISSEIVNVDSPRTMDSGPLDVINVYPQISPEIDSSMLPLSDNLCDQMLSLLDCQGISVKPEDGPFQDDSGNYILPQLEDEKGLPWWDWP